MRRPFGVYGILVYRVRSSHHNDCCHSERREGPAFRVRLAATPNPLILSGVLRGGRNRRICGCLFGRRGRFVLPESIAVDSYAPRRDFLKISRLLTRNEWKSNPNLGYTPRIRSHGHSREENNVQVRHRYATPTFSLNIASGCTPRRALRQTRGRLQPRVITLHNLD